MPGRTGKCPDCGTDISIPNADEFDLSSWEEHTETDRVGCPMCGEMIISSAAKCRFCGEQLRERPSDESVERVVEQKIKEKQDSEIATQLFATGLIGCVAPILAIYGLFFLIRRPYDFPRKTLAIVGTVLHCIWSLIWMPGLLTELLIDRSCVRKTGRILLDQFPHTRQEILNMTTVDETVSCEFEQPTCNYRHQLLLAMSLMIFMGAFILEIRDDRVYVGWETGHPLPDLCAMRGWLGIDCPTCGLTRSLIHLAHNDWRASVAIHPLGWLIALAVLVQIPYRCYALSSGQDEPFGHSVPLIYWNGLIVLLMVNWISGIAFDSGR